jgi:hypothetical protein
MRKTALIISIFIYFLSSCSSIKLEQSNFKTPYENWVKVVDNSITEDKPRVIEKCKGDFFLDILSQQIRLIDLKKNKNILDTLVQIYGKGKGFIIIDSYFQGFNQWHTTDYWIVKNKKYCQGISYVKVEIDPLYIENAIPLIKQ